MITSWRGFPVSFDTTGVSDGTYQIQALATDVAGNTHADAATNVLVDNTVQLLGPLFKEGVQLGGTSSRIGVETLLVRAKRTLRDLATERNIKAGALINGARVAVFLTRQGLLGLDSATGAVKFERIWRSRS